MPRPIDPVDYALEQPDLPFMDANIGRGLEPSSGTVKSAGRVLDLLELLARHDGPVPHADLADGLGIPKSSLTQLLKDLVARGYVEFVPQGRVYRIGPAVAALARRADGRRDLVAIAEPVLRELTEKTGESSALNVRKGGDAEVIATVSGPHRLVTHMRLGDLAPLYATSGGKVLLTHLPEAELREYLASVRFEAVTPNTISSAEEFRRQLAAARRDGVAYSFEEYTPGIVGIGAPILGPDGRPVASFNVAMPTVRHTPKTRDMAVDALKRAARRVSRRLVALG